MADFFAIDLGTTNCAIKHFSINNVSSMLNPTAQLRSNIVSVPFYYENYRLDANNGFTDSSAETDALIPAAAVGSFRFGFRRPAALAHVAPPAAATDTNLMLMPSVVYPWKPAFADTSAPVYLTGRPALTMYQESNCAGILYENTKALMDQQITFSGVTAVDIARHLLYTCFSSIRHYMDKRNLTDYARIAISYPASRDQREFLGNLRAAARLAARDARLISDNSHDDFYITTQEPYAAVLNLVFNDCIRAKAYATNAGTEPSQLALEDASGDKVVLVVDLGGGTSDICLTIVRPETNRLCTYPENTTRDGRQITCAVNLSGNFGGADFDRLLASLIIQRLRGNDPRPIDQESSVVEGRAILIAQEMKHFFSNNPDATEFTRSVPYILGGDDPLLLLNVPRTIYAAWISPYIESQELTGDSPIDKLYKRIPDHLTTTTSIRTMIESTLIQANAEWQHVDALFLTGGTSHMPEVRTLMERLVLGSRCRVIVSNDCFFDIAAGAALYAALNHRDAAAGLSKYSPAPRSSIALFCDGSDGYPPEVLIDNSEAFTGEKKTALTTFKVDDNSLFKMVQLFTGTSYRHPNYSKLQVMTINLNGLASVGTELRLNYIIDQNMNATLSACFTDVAGQEREVSMSAINLYGATVTSSAGDSDEAADDVQHSDNIARGIKGRYRPNSNRILTTVANTLEVARLLEQSNNLLETFLSLSDGMLGVTATKDALKQLALDHLDVLCYSVMLNVHRLCRFDNSAIHELCHHRLAELICSATAGCSPDELHTFSVTLYKMLRHWPTSSRWYVAGLVLTGVIPGAHLEPAYKDKIVTAYCNGLLRNHLNWQGKQPFAFTALVRRAQAMRDEAQSIFLHVLDFIYEFAGAGRYGITLPWNLGVSSGPMHPVLKNLPLEDQAKLAHARSQLVESATPDVKSSFSALTRCFEINTEISDGAWLTTLNARIAAADDTAALSAVIAAVQGLSSPPFDRNHEASPRLLQLMSTAVTSSALTPYQKQGLFRILLVHAMGNDEEHRRGATAALNRLATAHTDPLTREISMTLQALSCASTTPTELAYRFDRLLSAHKAAVDSPNSPCFMSTWKALVKNRRFSVPFRQYLEQKLENTSCTDTLPVRNVLYAFYNAFCPDACQEETVLQYVIPHQLLADFIGRATDIDRSGTTNRPASHVQAVIDIAISLLSHLVTVSTYALYRNLLSSHLTYCQITNGNADRGNKIAALINTFSPHNA